MPTEAPPPRRSRMALHKGLWLPCVFLIIVWIGSLWIDVSYQGVNRVVLSDSLRWRLAGGVLRIDDGGMLRAAAQQQAPEDRKFEALPTRQHDGIQFEWSKAPDLGGWAVRLRRGSYSIPMWMPTLLAAAAPVGMTIARRRMGLSRPTRWRPWWQPQRFPLLTSAVLAAAVVLVAVSYAMPMRIGIGTRVIVDAQCGLVTLHWNDAMLTRSRALNKSSSGGIQVVRIPGTHSSRIWTGLPHFQRELPHISNFSNWLGNSAALFLPIPTTTGVLLLILIGCTIGRRVWRRLRNRCPSCSYDLTGLPQHAPCPECGPLAAAA